MLDESKMLHMLAVWIHLSLYSGSMPLDVGDFLKALPPLAPTVSLAADAIFHQRLAGLDAFSWH